MTTIQELHREVWEFRREMAAYFPTPNQADSLAFAFTEIGEAVDATLRQNPIYKRNNAKEHTVERELAQCAMMLLTAVPEDWDGWSYRRYYYQASLPFVALAVAGLYGSGAHLQRNYETIAIVYVIGQLIDLPTHLRAELARMRAKHGPVRGDGPASTNEVANEHVIYTQPAEGLRLADYVQGGYGE